MIRKILAWMLPLLVSGPALADQSALWQAMRDGGHVVLMRHALAPGIGDPDDFALDNCDTQRNLSDRGRAQARRIGERMRENGIRDAEVYTSQWCRCRETAALLGLGPATDLPIVNSFFQRSGRQGPQTAALRQWIEAQPLTRPVVIVTHQVNISALTGTYASSGEMVVVRRAPDGSLSVAGTLKQD